MMMKYIFDNNTLTGIFRHYFPDSFPGFWDLFNEAVANGNILSVREVKNEINNYSRKDELEAWAKSNPEFFHDPVVKELQFITKIYSVPMFFNSINQKKLIKGDPLADPFIVAKAYVEQGTVVTLEKFKPNSGRIPNICDHFKIPCIDLQMFLRQNDWVFR